ncbi:MFS transporter [Devosia sp.]|uniref:MFS transporter n=1 Tax=Devosia sp. TaxID=1871048 RepID=UPI003264D40F
MTMPPQYRTYSCFFLYGVALGAMLSRIPDLQEHLGISTGELGLTLIGLSIGALIALTFSAPLLDRIGARITGLITILGTAVLFAVVPWLPSAQAVFAVLFCIGLLAGALEIMVNVQTDRLEAQFGKTFMSRAHGFWSLGFFVTAMIAAGVRQLGISMHVHLAVISALVVIAGFYMINPMVDAPARPNANQDKTPLIAFPSWGLIPLCIIGIAAFLVEGAGVDWSGVYMRDIFQVAPLIGGLGLTLFTLFMAMSRLFADPVIERTSPRLVASVLLGLSALGALMVGLAPAAWVALIGFALLGIGCSAVYPLAVSAAAQRTDRPSSFNVAALGQVSFVIFFLAPPCLGIVAQYLGIRNSYLITLPVIALGLYFAQTLSNRPTAVVHAIEPATPHG